MYSFSCASCSPIRRLGEWKVIAPDGRHWKAISDGSLDSRATSAEVVTPILRWDDLETLQAVVRALRHAGAKTPECVWKVHSPNPVSALGSFALSMESTAEDKARFLQTANSVITQSGTFFSPSWYRHTFGGSQIR